MFRRTKRDANEERLDELGEDLVRAARASEAEIDAGAGGGMPYSRIRASIAARQQDSESPTAGWLGLLRAARMAVPAMALVTVVVTCLPRLANNGKVNARRAAAWASKKDKGHTGDAAGAKYSRPTVAFDSDGAASPAQSSPPGPYILTLAAGTCALSNTQECAISDNEVLATLFADENQETK